MSRLTSTTESEANRLRAIKACRADGMTPRQIMRALDLPESTYYRLAAKLRAATALLPSRVAGR